jgi:hypothetical protein
VTGLGHEGSPNVVLAENSVLTLNNVFTGVAAKMAAGTAEDRFEWGLDIIVRGLGTYLTDPPTADARWPRD